MTTNIEYALMAGGSYVSTRSILNQFPAPEGWTPFNHIENNSNSFEAIAFQKGNEIVISYAGTYPSSARRMR